MTAMIWPLFPSKAHRLRMEKLDAASRKSEDIETQTPGLVARSIEMAKWLHEREARNHVAEGLVALFNETRGEK